MIGISTNCADKWFKSVKQAKAKGQIKNDSPSFVELKPKQDSDRTLAYDGELRVRIIEAIIPVALGEAELFSSLCDVSLPLFSIRVNIRFQCDECRNSPSTLPEHLDLQELGCALLLDRRAYARQGRQRLLRLDSIRFDFTAVILIFISSKFS